MLIVVIVAGVNKYAQRECAICATRVYLYCIYISCCAGLPTVCRAVPRRAGGGARGVAEPSRVWRKSQKYFVHATEMRKIHFGHWQWVPAAFVRSGCLCLLCAPPFPSAVSTVAICMLEYYLCTATDSVNCAVSVCRSCSTAGILTNFQAGSEERRGVVGEVNSVAVNIRNSQFAIGNSFMQYSRAFTHYILCAFVLFTSLSPRGVCVIYTHKLCTRSACVS